MIHDEFIYGKCRSARLQSGTEYFTALGDVSEIAQWMFPTKWYLPLSGDAAIEWLFVACLNTEKLMPLFWLSSETFPGVVIGGAVVVGGLDAAWKKKSDKNNENNGKCHSNGKTHNSIAPHHRHVNGIRFTYSFVAAIERR